MSKTVDAEPWSAQLGSKLLAALRDASDEHIDQELIPQIMKTPGRLEIMRLVEFCADNQALLRLHNRAALTRFCIHAVEVLGSTKCDSWPGIQASLKVLEGVVLMCSSDHDDRPWICQVVQSLLKARFLPRQTSARLESAVMSLSEPRVRVFYADSCLPRQPDDVQTELQNLVDSLRPTRANEQQRQSVFEIFDEVVFKCFGVHGKQFGSAVNGFQMKSSDIDIMVLLESDLQLKLIAEARRLSAEESERGEEEQGANRADWSFLSARSQVKIASIAATRALALELRNANLNVTEVIESARVPIVKCKHALASHGEDDDESHEFEIDISFCNHIAYYNSRLLRAYANFDHRAMTVGLLVKLWAKRRKINSALEGTLSSYSYTLMAIHYLQTRGVLPNLQALSADKLEKLQISSTEHLLEGHNVWFADPDVYREQVLGDEGDCGDAENEQLVLQRWWLDGDPIKASVPELFYGFFRYFALEFNAYADVVSIRLEEERVSKLSYFSVNEEEQDGSEVGDEDEQQEEVEGGNSSSDEGAAGEARFTGKVVEYDEEVGWGKLLFINGEEDAESYDGEVMIDREEYERSDAAVGDFVTFSVGRGAKGNSLAQNVQLVGQEAPAEGAGSAALEAASSASTRVPHAAASAVDPASLAPLPELLVGTVRSFNAETCYGFIACEATFGHYKRDVFLHQNQAVGVAIGDRVSFQVELSNKGQPQARQVVKVSLEMKETPSILLATAGEDASTDVPKAEAARGRLPSGRLGIAEKRLRGRHCLCIDDPMERNRTLGVTYAGQEAISSEMLRALSILKNREQGAVEKIFKAVDKRKVHQAREYDPVPSHVFGWSRQGEDRIVIEIERPIDKSMVGRIIGTGGAAIKSMRDESGVDDLHINDTKSGPVLYARGDTPSLQRAMTLAERAMYSKGKSKNRSDVAGSSAGREAGSQRGSQGGKGASGSASSNQWGSKSQQAQQVLASEVAVPTQASAQSSAGQPSPMPSGSTTVAQLAQSRASAGKLQQQSSPDADSLDEGSSSAHSRRRPVMLTTGDIRETGLAGRGASDTGKSFYNSPTGPRPALLATTPPGAKSSPQVTVRDDASRSSASSSLKGTLRMAGLPSQGAGAKRPPTLVEALAQPEPSGGTAASATAVDKLSPSSVGTTPAPEAQAAAAAVPAMQVDPADRESHQRKKGNKIGAWKK